MYVAENEMVTEEFCKELHSVLQEFYLSFHVNYIAVALHVNT